MSIAITGAAGQLGRLVIDDLLSAGIPGTDLIAIARPRPEIGHLDETDRCGHRMRRVYCRSTTRCERTQMLRSYIMMCVMMSVLKRRVQFSSEMSTPCPIGHGSETRPTADRMRRRTLAGSAH